MTTTHTNTDPEALIENMAHELAYERVKRSSLFDSLESNAAVDAKADELAREITELVEAWLAKELRPYFCDGGER